jgi:hypothetical protein
LISQLRKDGAETTEATRKLDLLLVALEEMQLQIARLTPSAIDRAGVKKSLVRRAPLLNKQLSL